MGSRNVSGFLRVASLLLVAGWATAVTSPVLAAAEKAQITVLYDAFGTSSTMTKDWGFSALVEYGGKRILFDTGNNAEIFARNVKAKGVDLTTLDFAVISHRHGDHTSGLGHLFAVNPGVKVYAPKENFGVFGAALPGTFYKRDESLPADMRYFDGKPPEMLRFGSPGRRATSPGSPRRPRSPPGFI
jgi:7,8-dihydropterin-6-yl-methyl-4-(beta-D-ribofuranosyl)aminobenzene 5'-phosphate synthase